MGRAIAEPQRQMIFQRAGLGHKVHDIAADLGLNPESVRKLIRRFQRMGISGIASDYSRCGVHQSGRAEADLIEAAVTMRRLHPDWGSGIIRVLLAERHPDRSLPSERTIQRAFARADLSTAPAGRRRGQPNRRAKGPHETWQMDAADQMKLDDGQACWLRIVNECTGQSWRRRFSPLGFWNAVPATETQAALRRGFARWGKPQRIRVDNGTPWRSKGDLDRSRIVAGRTRGGGEGQPASTSSGQRCGGTLARHGQAMGRTTPGRIGGATPGHHQRDGPSATRILSLPGPGGRLAAHPDLEHSGRAYDASREEEDWALERAQDLLAGFVVARQVDRAGMISVYNRNYYVGKSYVGKSVHVRYDPQQRLWLFQEEGGHLVNRHEAAEIDAANIRRKR